MSIAEAGVYWPFKSLLSGSGIVLTETSTGISIATTGAGPGGGDMLISVFATNGKPGVVDTAVTAQTVSGVVAHATLADTVPWGGITGAPTVYPTDWSVISNKPATFTPSAHGPTHVTTDVIPSPTTTAPGLVPKLSGNTTDYFGGDGAWHALGSSPVNITQGLTVQGGATVAGGLTADSLTLGGALQINNGFFLVNDPTGAWCGIYNTGTNNAGIGFANGANITSDSCILYKPSGQTALFETYFTGAGAQSYTAEVVTVQNPNGVYNFRSATRLVGTNNLPGDQTAWTKAPFLSQSSSNGGFAGYGMVSQAYWGCCLGAWQTGLYLATSANTFVQLTDNMGHIVAGALAAGVAVANIGYTPQPNLGYTPLNKGGDTMTGQLTMQGNSIVITGGATFSIVGSSGYQWALEVSGPNLYAVRINDSYVKQLAP